MTQTAQISLGVSVKKTKASGLAAGSTLSEWLFNTTMDNGTSSGKADREWNGARNLASGANESLDFNGALTDEFGDAAVFAKIKVLAIKAKSTNTTNLTIGNGTNPFQGPLGAAANTIVLAPGEAIVLVSPTGWTCGAAASDVVKVANAAGAAADYEIMAVGTSA